MAELRVAGGTFRLGDGAGGIFDWMVREVEEVHKETRTTALRGDVAKSFAFPIACGVTAMGYMVVSSQVIEAPTVHPLSEDLVPCCGSCRRGDITSPLLFTSPPALFLDNLPGLL
jgi:hypothetical protein